jgi:microcystin degradation protein MlrC
LDTAVAEILDGEDDFLKKMIQINHDEPCHHSYCRHLDYQIASIGVGKPVILDLGGKVKMPSISRQSRPIRVEGIVKIISNGQYRITGPMGRGTIMSMGTSAVLDTGDVEIVVISSHVEPYDPGCFTSVGIVPEQKRFLMLKSRIHYRAGFRDMAKAVVECAGCGVCTSDYGELTFRNIRRPIYPLDAEGFDI